MPYASRAQQGYMHAAAARGDVPQKVVKDFDKATSAKQYARLPGHVEHDAKGGFAGRLVRRYFGGGRADPEHHHAEEHDDRREEYLKDDGHETCQHFAHGGQSSEHSPVCYDHPEHPMYGGGFTKPEHQENDRESEESFERDEERDVGEHPRGGELRELAHGGHVRHFAQGGESEEETMHLQGADWQDDERNRKRSPLAERLSGARMSPERLHGILRKPGSRVP